MQTLDVSDRVNLLEQKLTFIESLFMQKTVDTKTEIHSETKLRKRDEKCAEKEEKTLLRCVNWSSAEHEKWIEGV